MPAHLIAEEGPLRGLILNLEEGDNWVIGRNPDEVDFVIEDHTVSRKQARLFRTPDGIFLENLSKVNPTLINYEEPIGAILLKEGDKVQIGHTVFFFSEEDVPSLQPKPKKQKKKKKEGYDDIFGDLDLKDEKSAPKNPEDAPAETEKMTLPPTQPPQSTAYDTIFEDTGEESELPFNLLSETPLILKVISGPNAGAEIGIEKGRIYTIGKDPAASDIVFQDMSVSRHHAQLDVSSDGVIEIEDLGSKNGTMVNGVALTAKQIITPQDLISLGTTAFLIIDREAPQETIYSSLLGFHEPQKVVEEEEAALVSKEIESEKIDWKKEKIPFKYLVIGGSFAAIFLIVFISFFSLFKTKGIEVAYKDPEVKIQEALAKFQDVQFSFNPASGKLFLVGHVETSVDYQEMRFRIQEIQPIQSVEDTVVIDELVAKTMNDVIQDNPAWRAVNIQSPAAGKFTALGYVDTNEEATRLFDYLTVNFPYLDRLSNQIVAQENLTAQVQGIVLSKGFATLSLQVTNGEVILSGNYSNKMEKEYMDMLTQLQHIQGVSGVKNYAAATHPNLAAINLSDQYAVSGLSQFDGQGYSAILNGKIYTLGDTIGGMKITMIEQNAILLEKDGIKYKIDYIQ
jgi:type III secretion system YscD/HrpQ family protein